MLRFQQKYKNVGIHAKNGAATRDGVREHKSHIWGIPPQIIVIYTTMSPILFIFGPKVPPTNLQNFGLEPLGAEI